MRQLDEQQHNSSLSMTWEQSDEFWKKNKRTIESSIRVAVSFCCSAKVRTGPRASERAWHRCCGNLSHNCLRAPRGKASARHNSLVYLLLVLGVAGIQHLHLSRDHTSAAVLAPCCLKTGACTDQCVRCSVGFLSLDWNWLHIKCHPAAYFPVVFHTSSRFPLPFCHIRQHALSFHI